MSEKLRNGFLKYGSCALFVGLLAWLHCSLSELGSLTRVNQYRVLCDAFTIPGVTLLMLGALVWGAGLGSLDGIAYLLHNLKGALIPGGRTKRETGYREFVEERRGKRKKGYGFLVISGLIALGVALVFLILFYSIY